MGEPRGADVLWGRAAQSGWPHNSFPQLHVGMEMLFLQLEMKIGSSLLCAGFCGGRPRSRRGASAMRLAQPHVATSQNRGLKCSTGLLVFIKIKQKWHYNTNCGSNPIVYAALNWAQIVKLIDFGGIVEWILFKCFSIVLFNLLRLRKLSSSQLERIWLFGQNYV